MPENQQTFSSGSAVKGTRRKARELALQALYQIEITGDASAAAVDLFLEHFEGNARAKEFARRLVSGVVSQRTAIDQRVEQCTDNWKLARLAKVDLVILRMATYELVFCPDIPSNVSLDEAIEIGKRFSSAESAAFLNGVLDQVAQSSAVKSE
ncbi:MAG TPA: transcription antitermination factor NusB [Candidatus Binatia bacterium]|jgi:N utilization substance protein B|nr:transcription antitermination factor NusB [Candidatus Binatia bacterium]